MTTDKKRGLCYDRKIEAKVRHVFQGGVYRAKSRGLWVGAASAE
jgi:hypothetical protein